MNKQTEALKIPNYLKSGLSRQPVYVARSCACCLKTGNKATLPACHRCEGKGYYYEWI